MKTKFTLLAILMVAFSAIKAQQLPNNSFETWTNSNTPDGWSTYESALSSPLGLSEKDAVDYTTGQYSIKLHTANIQGAGTFAGLVSLGNFTYQNSKVSISGIAFPYRPDSLFFNYKYFSTNKDTFPVLIQLTKQTAEVFNRTFIIFDTSNVWKQGFIPLTTYYTTNDAPDSLLIQFTSSVGATVVGTTLNVDNVLFGYVNLPTDLQEVANKLNFSIFPNPTAEVLNIATDMNADGFKVIVWDISGKVVDSRTLQGNRTSMTVSNYANGTYVYRIADKTGNVLKTGQFNVAK